MRRKSRWYLYPIILALVGFGLLIAFYDVKVSPTPVEKVISYDQLQK